MLPVSIPRSEFCVFKLAYVAGVRPSISPVSIPRSEFCVFKPTHKPHPVAAQRVSIPRSEFCVFKLYVEEIGAGIVAVSIPRSEFCVFKLLMIGFIVKLVMCFNSPFGILCL